MVVLWFGLKTELRRKMEDLELPRWSLNWTAVIGWASRDVLDFFYAFKSVYSFLEIDELRGFDILVLRVLILWFYLHRSCLWAIDF